MESGGSDGELMLDAAPDISMSDPDHDDTLLLDESELPLAHVHEGAEHMAQLQHNAVLEMVPAEFAEAQDCCAACYQCS